MKLHCFGGLPNPISKPNGWRRRTIERHIHEVFGQRQRSYRLRLIDEHYRDIILYFIQQLAFVTDKPVLCLIQMDITFAFRAGQNVKKFLA